MGAEDSGMVHILVTLMERENFVVHDFFIMARVYTALRAYTEVYTSI